MQSPPSTGATAQLAADGKKKAKKRVRAFTSDDRASHRVIEKQRREALNQQFLELARLLPGLANVRRLSKSVIVSESIAYLKAQRDIRLAAAKEVRQLLIEYDNALKHLNNRQDHHETVLNGQHGGRPVSKALLDLLNVEDEKFGTFPGGFGDNGPSDEHEEDHGFEDITQEQTGVNDGVGFIAEEFLSNEVPRSEHNPESGFIEQLDGQIQPLPNHDIVPLLLGQSSQPPIQPIIEENNCVQNHDFDAELGLGWTDIDIDQTIPVQNIPTPIIPNFDNFSHYGSLQHELIPDVSFQNSHNYFVPQGDTRSHETLNSYQVHNPY